MAEPGPGSLVERVLLAVSLVPAGSVVTYGDVASLVGLGPRQVGAILREGGGDVPWWRVVGHDGRSALAERARTHWDAEGVAVRADGQGCQVRAHHADLMAWGGDYRFEVAMRGWSVAQVE